jgi:putative SOS response-associated peptidase YedK
MINARSETAATKPAFRDALKYRRCLIPADVFYEWTRIGEARQPYCFEASDGNPFAFAGLWDQWQDSSGKIVETCSILTTSPNSVTSAVRDRMPVILDPDMTRGRSWDERRGLGVRAIETLRCPVGALLSNQHSDQSRGE